MSTKTPILTDKAPKPLPGIYSQAIVANGVVYCSGAVPMDAATGKLIDGDVKAHTVRTQSSQLIQLNCCASFPDSMLISSLQIAPMHQESDSHPRGGRHRHYKGGEGQRLPV
jgi:hypothetical protein